MLGPRATRSVLASLFLATISVDAFFLPEDANGPVLVDDHLTDKQAEEGLQNPLEDTSGMISDPDMIEEDPQPEARNRRKPGSRNPMENVRLPGDQCVPWFHQLRPIFDCAAENPDSDCWSSCRCFCQSVDGQDRDHGIVSLKDGSCSNKCYLLLMLTS